MGMRTSQSVCRRLRGVTVFRGAVEDEALVAPEFVVDELPPELMNLPS